MNFGGCVNVRSLKQKCGHNVHLCVTAYNILNAIFNTTKSLYIKLYPGQIYLYFKLIKNSVRIIFLNLNTLVSVKINFQSLQIFVLKDYTAYFCFWCITCTFIKIFYISQKETDALNTSDTKHKMRNVRDIFLFLSNIRKNTTRIQKWHFVRFCV